MKSYHRLQQSNINLHQQHRHRPVTLNVESAGIRLLPMFLHLFLHLTLDTAYSLSNMLSITVSFWHPELDGKKFTVAVRYQTEQMMLGTRCLDNAIIKTKVYRNWSQYGRISHILCWMKKQV